MLSSSKLIYLATPYSHSSVQVRQERFEIACRTAGLLMRQGVFLYCPITHTHPIACTVDLPLGWEYWKEYDELMLSRCNELWIVKMPGWDISAGIAGEIEIANRLGKPVRYFLPATIEDLRDFLREA